MANHVFSNVSSLRPGRSVFDWSYAKKFTCDMGQLIPVLFEEVTPGMVLSPIANEVVVRFQPLVAPILHEVSVFVHYFFIPFRLLWPDESTDNTDGWENFIVGGVDGMLELTPPTWNPTDKSIYSLWDYFGLPIEVDPQGAYPLDWMRRSYSFVYNEFYRDQDVQTVELPWDNESVVNRAWAKDYFSASRPFLQKGQAPALPVSGTSSAVWANDVYLRRMSSGEQVPASDEPFALASPSSGSHPVQVNTNGQSNMARLRADPTEMDNNVVDLSSATTFDIKDLRYSVQIQKWLERNARAGTRYKEFINAHFGYRVAPSDERLQRPEYIGGTRAPVIVSEVLQTSASGLGGTPSDTPQANMAGHGITAGTGIAGSYRVREFGVVMGLMSVMPKPAYEQGINRQWLRRTRYDFYFPEFSHLSEQAVEQAEIYASGVQAENRSVFGYVGRYDELRVKNDQVCSGMRMRNETQPELGGKYDYWHLGRQWDSGAPPSLNSDFIQCKPDKRIFAVQDEPGLIVNFANRIRMIGPLPGASNPGLMDHF